MALITLSWLVAEPPFASADELGHYLRAMSFPIEGVVGEEAPDFESSGFNEQQRVVVVQEVRRVEVGDGLSPAGWTCYVGNPGLSAACLELAPPPSEGVTEHETIVGTYPPAWYALPGLVGSMVADPGIAAGIASGVDAVVAVGFLGLATALLWDRRRGPLSLLGMAVAVTPMVLYIAASLNPSGPEIGAGAALGAALLRLSRAGRPPALAWWVVAAAGVAMTVARSVSPAWLVAYGMVFVVWAGPGRIAELVREHRRAAVGVGAALTLGLLGAGAWAVAYATDAPFGLEPPATALREGWLAAREAVTRHAVGVFGFLEYNLPGWIYNTWHVLVVLLLAVALAVGRWRERVALAAVAAGAFLAPVLLHAALLRNTGFVVQGRHVLPILVVVPLLAGEVVLRRTEDRAAVVWRLLPLIVAAGAATVHVGAWYMAGRRAAVGLLGPLWFIGRSEWNPPLGWSVWAAVTLLGAACLVAAFVPTRRPEESGPVADSGEATVARNG